MGTQINVNNWLQDSLLKIAINGLTQDIHLDQIIGAGYEKMTKKEVFNTSYQIFKDLTAWLLNVKLETHDFVIYLNIDLISESNAFSGKPETVEEIIDLIDMQSAPEIIIFKEIAYNGIIFNELYRTPLLIESLNSDSHTKVLYKEHRSIETILSNGSFTREINIYYDSN